MCGIAGIIGPPDDSELIFSMINIMKHRGPDSQGYYINDTIHLGHCRLSINDLSDKAKQPFISKKNKIAVLVNGEIYNFFELKNSLIAAGHNFKSNSDSEVVLHGYIESGKDFIKKLNGMFAIAIYDNRTKELFLARDRLGIKPLYYTKINKQFLFASELKALVINNDVPLDTDIQSLGEYLVFENYFGEKTLNKHIKIVEPGQILSVTIEDLSISKHFFWEHKLNYIDDQPYKNIIEQYLNILEASVKRHLISDVPVGCYLSSGIDSTSVAYYASKKLNKKINTYTGSFGIDGFYDEADAAKKVADLFGCLNKNVIIRPADFVSNIEEITYHLDEPRVGMGSFSQYMVAKSAALDVKVILTGHGGDEFYAGYPVFKAIFGTKNIFKIFLSSSPKEMMFFIYFSLLPIFRHELRYFLPNIFTIKSLRNILEKDFYYEFNRRTNFLEAPQKLQTESSNRYEQLFHTYLKFYLPALFVVEDKISMAFSLESRTPLCDNEMLDFALGISLSDKLKGNELKHIPRKAMRGKLPDFVFNLPKRGFPTPLRYWFKRELKNYSRDFILDNFHQIDTIMSRSSVERLITAYQGALITTPYDEIIAHKIWIILNLIWYFKHQNNRYRHK